MATAPDHGFAAMDLTDLNATIEGPIRLPAEQPVDVRLVNLEGAPIAGALVRLDGDLSGPRRHGPVLRNPVA